jgi:NAD(P)H-dependent FMN reductase
MAKIIGILGSPLTEGNTALLLRQALRGAADAGCEIEEIAVAGLDFTACSEMFFCRDHETCIMDDDMQLMYEKIKTADSIIVATPVMTMGIPGKLKSFVDRCQVFFMAKYLRKSPLVEKARIGRRKGLFICIAGMAIPEVFVGPRLTIKAFFDIIDCPFSDELLISDMDRIRDVKARCDLLDAAYEKGLCLGQALIQDCPS